MSIALRKQLELQPARHETSFGPFKLFALGFGQEIVRSAIWSFWQTSAASQFTKNLIYFCFIFSFAMLRLWLTLTILTLGLRQSCVRAD